MEINEQQHKNIVKGKVLNKDLHVYTMGIFFFQITI